MRVLVACEFSGTVRDAFAARGHDAWSCDILPTESPGNHIQGDAIKVLGDGWDLMVAHPPCTYLCNSGVRWLHERPERWAKMEAGAAFFRALWDAPIARIAIENPTPHKYARELIGVDYAQAIHPHEFGHPESKRTCLWLKNLPPLLPTDHVTGRRPTVHHASPGPNRGKARSVFFSGIAKAMAEQWG